MSTQKIHKRKGAYLPHWTTKEGIYFVTFRLADSLPSDIREDIKWERDDIVRTAAYVQRDLSQYEKQRLQYLHSDRLQRLLDAGNGSCIFKDDHNAQVVSNALQNFDGDRYTLLAWCVMPNHVHVVVQPLNSYTISKILHSWKSFTANMINTYLNRKGVLWQEEYYDHLVRDASDLQRVIRYTWNNPEEVGLHDWPWRWKCEHGLEARATSNT